MKINNISLSVIVPVYKAEAFIERCSHSLLCQTLNSIEYIFINDCTPDSSMSILYDVFKRYPHRKDQIIVINNPYNQGVAACRQKGLDVANGEYIAFCDSDDWCDSDMFYSLYTTALSKKADIVCCGYYVERLDSCHEVIYTHKSESKEDMEFDISPKYGALWNKIVRRELIVMNDIAFYKDINMGEDFAFLIRCRFYSQCTIFMEEAYYHYNQRNNNSIYTTFDISKNQQIIAMVEYISNFFLEKGGMYDLQLNYLKLLSKSELITNSNIKDFLKWRETFPEAKIDSYTFNRLPFNIVVLIFFVSIKLDFVANILLRVKKKIQQCCM